MRPKPALSPREWGRLSNIYAFLISKFNEKKNFFDNG